MRASRASVERLYRNPYWRSIISPLRSRHDRNVLEVRVLDTLRITFVRGIQWGCSDQRSRRVFRWSEFWLVSMGWYRKFEKDDFHAFFHVIDCPRRPVLQWLLFSEASVKCGNCSLGILNPCLNRLNDAYSLSLQNIES